MGDALVRTDEALSGMCVDLGKCHVGGFFEDRETPQVHVVLAHLGFGEMAYLSSAFEVGGRIVTVVALLLAAVGIGRSDRCVSM